MFADFLILSLATWRIASLFVNETGPWDVFARLRVRVGVRFDAYSNPYAENGLAEMFLCLWCFSIWTGIFLALLYLFVPYWQLLAWPCALSAGAIFLQKIMEMPLSLQGATLEYNPDEEE